jgi:hypothetical protein
VEACLVPPLGHRQEGYGAQRTVEGAEGRQQLLKDERGPACAHPHQAPVVVQVAPCPQPKHTPVPVGMATTCNLDVLLLVKLFA